MKKENKKLPILWVALMAVIPVSSYATLGESSSSIVTDNKVLGSTRASILKTQTVNSNTSIDGTTTEYQVSTIQTADNITIKEYVANGVVFAVSWSGVHNPDLQQILGKYFPTFKTAKTTNYGLRVSKISYGNLVVHINGVIGNFHGVAYDSSLLPFKFNLQDLK